jgi:hypothetical protein
MAYDPDILARVQALRAQYDEMDPYQGATALNGASGYQGTGEQPPAPPPMMSDVQAPLLPPSEYKQGAPAPGPLPIPTPGAAAAAVGLQQNSPLISAARGLAAGLKEKFATPETAREFMGLSPQSPIISIARQQASSYGTKGPAQRVLSEDPNAPPQMPAQAEPPAPRRGGGGGGGGGGVIPGDPGGPRMERQEIKQTIKAHEDPRVLALRSARSESLGEKQNDLIDWQSSLDAAAPRASAQAAIDIQTFDENQRKETARLAVEAAKSRARYEAADYYSDVGGGMAGQIGAALLIGLGSLGASMQGKGGENVALKIINKKIDDYMEKEKRAYDLSKVGREEQALRLASLRSAYLEEVSRDVDVYSKRIGTEQASLNGEKIKIGLQQSQLQAEAAAGQAALAAPTEITTHIKNEKPKAGGGGGAPASKGIDEGLLVTLPNGTTARFATKEEASAKRTQVDTIVKLQDAIKRRAEIVKRGPNLINQAGKEYAQVQGEIESLGSEMDKIEGRVRLTSEGKAKIQTVTGGDPGDPYNRIKNWAFDTSGTKATLSSLDNRLGYALNGGRIVETGTETKASGEKEWKAKDSGRAAQWRKSPGDVGARSAGSK